MRLKNLKYFFLALLTGGFSSVAEAQVGLCPDNLNFEKGTFSNWICQAGIVDAGGNLFLSPTPPIPGQHTIIDATSAGTDPYGLFPQNCPNGSRYSVKLGNNGGNHQAESISYTYAIPATLPAFSMLFHYAVVLQNPNHQFWEQPRFRARITDMSTNLPIPCVDFDFIASASLPGFLPSPVNPTVVYKDWTPITVNLNAYIGRTIKLELITNDCVFTAHFGYAYVDVNTNCNGAISGNTICPGDTAITLTAPYGFQAYEWYSDMSFGTMLSNTQTLYLNPPPAVGTVFPVIVIPYNGFGCRDTLYATVNVGAKPVADAGPDVDICEHRQVQIGAPSNPIYAYLWTPGGQVSNQIISNPLALTITPNPEEFIVKTTDILTGCVAYDTTYIRSRQADTVIVLNGSNTYCAGDPTAGTLSVHNVVTAVQWYNGTTPIPGATGFTYQPIVSGNYWAQVQQFGCTDSTASITFTINPLPVSVAGPDGSICTNNETIQIGAPANPAYTYSWTPAGQVSNPAIANPIAWTIGATTTEFIVHTTDPVSGCNSYDTTYITGRVVDTTILLNGSNTYCAGDPAAGILSVHNVLSAVQWYNGITPIPGATGFSYQPIVSGNYWAQVQQFGCTDSTASITFIINPTPVSVAGPDASICTNNQTIQIGAPANPAYTYSWTPAGQVSDPAIADPIAWAIGATTTEFIVHTTDPVSGCNSYDTMYITGRVVDTALQLNGSNTYCAGDPAAGTLSVHNVLSAVQWYNGITPIPGANGFTYQPTVSGNYWAQVQQLGCTDSTITITFIINPLPASVAGPDGSICTNSQTIQIGAPPNPAYNYSWTPTGQVSDPAIANPIAWTIGATTTEFIVHTTDPVSGCNSYDTTYITGRVVDTAIVLSGISGYCNGIAAGGTLSVHNAVTAVQWYEGTTAIPGATGISYHPLVSGNYWAQVRQFGCTDSTATIPFAIHDIPLVSFTANSDTGCITNHSFIFTNGSSVTDGSTLSYLWKFSDGTTQTVTDPIKKFLTIGNYTVKLITTTNFGCKDSSNNMVVHVLPNGNVNFKWDSICINRPVYFYNLSNEHGSVQVNYNWTFNNGGPGSSVKNPLPVIYNTVGQKDVTLILTALGCENDPDTMIRRVQVNVPKPGITYNPITVPQFSSQFIHVRDSIGNIFNWRPRIQLSKYDAMYTEFYAVDDVKYLIDISDIHTCVTTDTMQILVLKKPGWYLPTAFTPNGDGLNDDVQPYLIGMKGLISFSVFNRWGNLVFYTRIYGKKWDGKYLGVNQNPGVFVWYLEFYDNNNKKVTQKGTITLIR